MQPHPIEIKIHKLERTGLYEKMPVLFFIKTLEVCYVPVVLHGEKRRCKALLDEFTNVLCVQGLVGTFPHSDLRWPATVTVFGDNELEIRWGPHDYNIDFPSLENLAFK